MALLMIEDILNTVILAKLTALKSNLNILDNVISADNSTLQSLKQFLSTKQINIRRGFPISSVELPCVAILLGNDPEVPDSIGDQDLIIGEDGAEEYVITTLFQPTYRLEVWTDNGDLTTQLYTVLKWIMLASRNYLSEVGLIGQRLGGTDFEPAPEYFPTFVYRRALLLDCQVDMTVPNIDTDEEIHIVDTLGEVTITPY